MKFNALLIVGLLGFFSEVNAENLHLHAHPDSLARPKPTDATVSAPSASPDHQVGVPGYCEIEIINRSYDDVRVSGVFDDGLGLVPFYAYSFGYPEYISLYYYGYCHDGMDLYIDTYYGRPVFSGYVSRWTTIRIVPEYSGSKELKAIVQSK